MSSTTTTSAPTTATRPEPARGSRLIGATANYIDERTSISGLVKEVGRKIFPDHWSFMLGEVALYSFVVVLLSGTFLTFFFQASMTEVVYNGSYVPLKGVEMSTALQSTFDVANGARVVFGPAKRPLPQLPITVDDEGYLIAQSDFLEPVGPSYWERLK